MEPRPTPSRRWIAFLRAINVGGRTVKMDRLREIFEEMGMASVATFIASGNVIFEAAGEAEELERRIEEGLERALGFGADTFLRSPAELAAVAARRPFPPAGPEGEAQALSVAFLKSPPAPDARERLAGHRSEIDDFHVHGREVYWSCRTRVSESRFSGAVLERALGTPATMRNVTTVRKLTAKYPPLP